MSEYIDKKYTVTCTIKIKSSYNSRCKDKDEAIECFKVQHEDWINQTKNCEITYDVIDHVELQIPKTPIFENYMPALCPNCKAELSEDEGDGYFRDLLNLSICDCGQKLKWGDVDEE